MAGRKGLDDHDSADKCKRGRGCAVESGFIGLFSVAAAADYCHSAAGKPYFDAIDTLIHSLSRIMEQRDQKEQSFQKTSGTPMVESR